MGNRRVLTLICDLCHKEDTEVDVVTHNVRIDGKEVVVEACTKCWWKAVKGIQPLAEVGRKPTKSPLPAQRKRRVAKSDAFNGKHWTFAQHALDRMAKRRLQPISVIEAAEDPDTTWPGRDDPTLEVRVRNGVKVVVNPNELTIVTAGAREEELSSA